MPIVSKYSSSQIENLVNALLDELRQQEATTELSLMCLGNAVSHIVNQNVPVSKRAELVQQFCLALSDSISSKT
ncbi:MULTISPECIES: YejL family protein [Alkalimonas]|uniref:DUF1414 domain-containing protein n=1 Tax=Alkalimonas mucilaginosa TaxID=3057676 RepID=A0ABU7JI87_9GAMM|nr:DUF1414 domain-containing protein [Alkalimonas sp. MEB004]MEE2025190.1 DUF1414 domain-containing protein [Alkalimonas sp. MEB004]